MKMWDEVADPDSKEARQRKATEEWLRERLPPPAYGWSPGGLGAELQALNQAAFKDGVRPAPYIAGRKFVSELLLVLEGEELVDCLLGPRGSVINAYPVGEIPVPHLRQHRRMKQARDRFRMKG